MKKAIFVFAAVLVCSAFTAAESTEYKLLATSR